MTDSLDFGNELCALHDGRKLIGYCTNCGVSVCFTCVSITCRGHSIEDNLSNIMAKYGTEAKSKFEHFVSEKLCELDQRLRDIDLENNDCMSKIDCAKELIKTNAKAIKEEKDKMIDDAAAGIFNKLDECQQEKQKRIQTFKDAIQASKIKVESLLNELEIRANQPLRALQIQHSIKDVKKEIEQLEDLQTLTDTEKLISISEETEIGLSQLRNRFLFGGTREVSDEDTYKSSDAVSVHDATELHSFKLFTDNVHNITSTNQNTSWIQGRDHLKLCDTTGVSLCVFDLNSPINSIACNRDGELLTTVPGKRVVNKFKMDNNSDIPFIETGNLFPCGIAVCPNKDIVVGLVEKYDFKLCSTSKRLLRVYDEFGRGKKDISGEEGGKKCIVLPERIAVSKSGDYTAVINRFQQLNGEILILYCGNIKYVFPDPSISKRKYMLGKSEREKFDPRDVDFDILNNIIICDYESRSILLINCETLQSYKQIYIFKTWPKCMTCFPDQTLWVGCADGIVKVLEYMSYEK